MNEHVLDVMRKHRSQEVWPQRDCMVSSASSPPRAPLPRHPAFRRHAGQTSPPFPRVVTHRHAVALRSHHQCLEKFILLTPWIRVLSLLRADLHGLDSAQLGGVGRRPTVSNASLRRVRVRLLSARIDAIPNWLPFMLQQSG